MLLRDWNGPWVPALMVLCLVLSLPGWQAAAESDRPNILWLTCEDMSARLGCYGDGTVPTPNIDSIARAGVRYTNCYGVYGVCAPNRHTLITGMYPTSTGAMAMRTWKRTSALDQVTDPELLSIPTYEATPPPMVRCFTEHLRAAGYYCTNNAKTDYQFRPPVTAWDESSKRGHWRNRPSMETPFFAVFNCEVTHESGTFDQRSPAVTNPDQVILPPYYPDTPIVRRDVARQYDNIAVLDSWVGERLAELKDAKLDEDTYVFFFSDHGDGLPRMKRWVYDSGLHVPLLVRHPGNRAAGTTAEQLVSFVDFAPTVLSLAEVELPPCLEGHAFLGKQFVAPRRYVYACRDRMDPAPERIRAVRDDRFKYVRNYRADLPYLGVVPYRDKAGVMQEILRIKEAGELGPHQWQFSSTKKPLEELYDTQSDPHEIDNLASDPTHFRKLAELREAHQRWRQNYGDLGDLDERDLVRELWPPNGVQPTTSPPQVSLRGEQYTISCETCGASIGYRFNRSDPWKLYSGPIRLQDTSPIYAVAHRIGWKPSKMVEYTCPAIDSADRTRCSSNRIEGNVSEQRSGAQAKPVQHLVYQPVASVCLTLGYGVLLVRTRRTLLL